MHVDKRTSKEKKEVQLLAFLSTSFSAMSSEDRRAIKEALLNERIKCRDLKETEAKQFLFSAIFHAIRSCNFMVLNATEVRPWTLFEVGLCAGLKDPKSVVCIFNDQGKDERVAELPHYIRLLSVVPYSFSSERLAKMAADVRREADDLLENPSEMEFKKVLTSGVSLRTARRISKSVYVTFPQDEIWDRALPAIRAALEKQGYNVITEEDMQLYGANCLQMPISCTSHAGPAIIDTSGDKSPDPLQCYKLGVARARPELPLLRIEQRGKEHPQVLDSIPAEYEIWSDVEGLTATVCRFIEKWESKEQRRNK